MEQEVLRVLPQLEAANSTEACPLPIATGYHKYENELLLPPRSKVELKVYSSPMVDQLDEFYLDIKINILIKLWKNICF